MDKAKKILKLRPTSLSKAIRETAHFYEKAMTGDRFRAQRYMVLERISEMLKDTTLVDWVRTKYDKIKKYDEYDEDDYEDELDEKFRRLEL